jgi:hypothetical protein
MISKRFLGGIVFLLGLFSVGLLGAGAVAAAAPTGFKTIGDAGYAWSQRTGWVQAFTASSQPVYGSGAFNPSAAFRPFVDGPDRYENRYGKGSWDKKGTLVGERAAGSRLLDVLNTLVHAPSNPLGLADPAHYLVSDVDQEDARLISRGAFAWYDAVLVPAYDHLTSPAPIPTPTPTPLPTPTPTPTPVPTPTPGPTACVRVHIPAQDLELRSTGQVTVTVVSAGPCPQG